MKRIGLVLVGARAIGVKHFFLVLGFLLTLFLLPTGSTAAWPGARGNDVQATATTLRFDQAVTAVAVQGNKAYLGMGSRLVIMDLTNPLAPFTLGDIELSPSTTISAITPYGQFVYTLDNQDHFSVLDIGNPRQPRFVGAYDSIYPPGEIAVLGRYAYITARNHDLIIIDLSNPAEPTQTGGMEGLGSLWGIAVAEDPTGSGRTYVYVAGDENPGPGGYSFGGGFRIVEVTHPTLPREVYPCRNSYYHCGGGWASDVAVLEGKAYVTYTDYEDPAYQQPLGLRVFDIMDNSRPVRLSFYETPDGAYHVTVAGSIAYVSTASGLYALDIGDPSQPQALAFYALSTPYDVRGDVAADENCAYVAEGERGLTILCHTRVPAPPVTNFLPMVVARTD